ncbi:unnamed protein product, partial [Dibothriocephalus latus]
MRVLTTGHSVSSSATGGEDTEDVLLRMRNSPWSGHSGSFAHPDRSMSKALLATPSPVKEKALSLEVADRRDSEKDSFDQNGGRSLSSASWSTATDEQGRSRRQKGAPLKVVDQTSKIQRARQLFPTRKATKITLQTPLQDEESKQDELLAQIRNLPKYVAYQIHPITAAEDCLKVQPVSAKQGLKTKPDTPGNAVLPDAVPLKKLTQSEEVLHPIEIRPCPKTAKRLSILGKVLKRSTETTSSLSSGLDSTSSDQSEIPQLHYFRPVESQVDEDAPKEMHRKDPIVLALIDTIMKCLVVFGSYSERQMEAIAPRMFNCPFDPHQVINVPKGSIFSDDPDGAYMDLFCFQVLDTIRAGISIAANDRYLLTLAHNLLKTFGSLGDLGLAPPEDFRIAVQRQREADDEAEAEAEADSTFDEFTKWSEVKRRSYLGSDWFDEPSSDSGATLLYRPP